MASGTQRGRFITFEGLDGCGKSTQLEKLAGWLRDQDLVVVTPREPGGTSLGERIRAVLLDSRTAGLDSYAEMALMFTSRAQLIAEVITPSLEAGKWVLCDRFSDSTRAYQGRLGKVAPAVLNAMERVTIGDLKPDLTIILDVPVEVGLKRAAARRGGAAPDRFESEDLKFHQDLRDAYREIAGAEPARCVLIDASGDANTVAASVWTALRDRFFSTAASPA